MDKVYSGHSQDMSFVLLEQRMGMSLTYTMVLVASKTF